MKFEEASQELKRCLKESKTISIPKLLKLLSSMNLSISKPSPNLKVLLEKDGIPTKIKFNNYEYALIHSNYINGNKNKVKER